jgi:beta-lactamase class A
MPAGGPGAPRPATPPFDSAALAAALRQRIGAVAGADVAVAVRDLGTGRGLSIAGDRSMHAASTMKLPVLVEYVRRRQARTWTHGEFVQLENRFRSVADGSWYALDPADDSDSTVYARVGQLVAVDWLAERMMTHSSNLATNVLVDRLGPAAITATARAFGMAHTAVRRGVEDGPAFRAGIVNETTADDLAALLSAIERGATTTPEGTHRMREILLAQAFNDGIPAGLPAGVRVGHKTGEITATHHDAAIVYPAGEAPYVLVVLTRAIPDRAVAVRLTADLARAVHAALRPAPALRE